MPSRAILLGYKTRGWASSRIANPLSLKANLDPTGLANPVSNPQWGCPLPDSQPFRSRAHSFLGANRPIGPWPIRSLALSLPWAKWPALLLLGTIAPWNSGSRNFPSVDPGHCYAICDLQPLGGSAAAACRTYPTRFQQPPWQSTRWRGRARDGTGDLRKRQLDQQPVAATATQLVVCFSVVH